MVLQERGWTREDFPWPVRYLSLESIKIPCRFTTDCQISCKSSLVVSDWRYDYASNIFLSIDKKIETLQNSMNFCYLPSYGSQWEQLDIQEDLQDSTELCQGQILLRHVEFRVEVLTKQHIQQSSSFSNLCLSDSTRTKPVLYLSQIKSKVASTVYAQQTWLCTCTYKNVNIEMECWGLLAMLLLVTIMRATYIQLCLQPWPSYSADTRLPSALIALNLAINRESR